VNKVSNRGAKNDKMSITEPIRENGENAKVGREEDITSFSGKSCVWLALIRLRHLS
jgi:hypothetical protein